MESSEEGELEDGEIADETGPEYVDEYDHFASTSSRKKCIPSLMSVNVAQKPLQYRGDSPSGYVHQRTDDNFFPTTAKYPASEVGGPEKSGIARKRSLKSSVHEFRVQNMSKESSSRVKRRRETSKGADTVNERRSCSSKQSRRSNRKQKQRLRRSHNRESEVREERSPLVQDEYEALLRKHHEIQELIVIEKEKEKLTSKGQKPDGKREERGGNAKFKGDKGQGSSSKLLARSRSRSRSSSLKKDGAVTTKFPLAVEENNGEVVEVKNQAPQEIIEILEDDDDDDELLQLRLLALESATKNVTAREEKENQAQKRQADKHSSNSVSPESKKAKQRERRQKVKQLFHKQSIAAEIFKVHGEKERFSRFMEIIASRRRSSLSLQGKSSRRSPSIGKESSKKSLESSSADDIPKEFQFDNYEEVEMDVSEMEESPSTSLTPVADTMDLSPDIIQIQALTGSDTDTPNNVQSSDQGTNSTVAEANKVEAVGGDDDDDDDDVMELREQLLRSLASKRAAKAQAREKTETQPEEYIPEEPSIQGPVYEPSPIVATSSRMSSPRDDTLRTSSPMVSSSPLSTPRTQSPLTSSSQGVVKPPAAKVKPKVLPQAIPTHKPVVIQFGDDSDTSDDEQSPHKPEMKQLNFLDQFLREARRTADAKKSKVKHPPPVSHYPQTPDAMRKLPEVQRAEYHKLKEEIARRELQKLGKLTPAGENSPGTQSPFINVTISITKVDGKVQRTVALKDSKTKDGEVTAKVDKAKDKEMPKDVKADVPQVAVKDNEQVKECQGKITKHRLTAEKDCRILTALDRQIQKRYVILKQMESKLQQLRDELAVGERIASSHRSQIRKYIQQKHLIRCKLQEHVTQESELRETLAKVKGVAIGDVNQSQMLLQVASQLPQMAAVNGGKQSTISSKSETELKRLQRLEREYASQISKLRETSAKTAKLIPNAVVRILKTKTKLMNKKQKPSPQLLTKDKIVLGYDTPTNTDSESDAERYLRTQSSKRRRSFLDDNPSLKPNLLSKSLSKQSSKSTTSHNKSTNSTTVDNHKPAEFNKSAPSGKAASKLENQKSSATSTSTKLLSKTLTILEGLVMPNDEQVERLRCAHTEKSKTAINASLLATNCGLSGAASAFKDDCLRRTDEVKMDIIEDARSMDDDDEDEALDDATLMSYSSPLLCFRSYRLSPFFVKEAQLSRLSPSFSHKINPMKALCKFELNGTCNDDECPWQHRKDYEMTDHDIYADILAYTPLIATSKDWHNAEKREQRIVDYINKAVRKSKRPETAKKQREALCRVFANAVLIQTQKVSPGVIISQPRSWTPTQIPTNPPHPSGDDTDPPMVPRGSKIASSLQIIPLGAEEHERYYSGEGIADLEAAVLDRPGDVQMWVKLAGRIIGDDRDDQDIDRGLNALSRGLESNQTSSDLWLQYLLLYSQRDDHSDLSELSQQALQFAPSYELYWQCLNIEETFTTKDVICEWMIAYLQSQQAKEMTTQGSHHLLEALMYRVQLYIMTRRVKAAVSLLQGALKEGTVIQHMTLYDRCFAWLMYIHMIEYQRLPPHLFDPTGSGIGHVVSKKPLIFDWGTSSAIHSPEVLRAAFQEALTACSSPDQQADDNMRVCLPLYRNLVVLEQLTGRHEQAKEICQKLLGDCPADAELWLLFMDVHKHQESHSSVLEPVIKNALRSCPKSAALYHAAAKSSLVNTTAKAVRILKLCAFAFYSIQDKSVYDDVEQLRRLYCSLLGQSLPFDYSPPELRPGINSRLVEEQSCHLWLNYCLLQELTAAESAACEAYERSLCHLSETEDAHKLWIEYLLFQKNKLAASQDKTTAFRTFTGLVNRCLVSMATRFPLPHSDDKTWLDYSFHNRVVELYIGCLKDGDQLDMYERFIGRMPSNVHLAIRACYFASKSLEDSGYLHRAKAIAVDTLNKFPECLPFWKIMIALSLHLGRLKEAKMLYQQALDAVPLAANLWKDYFLLEVVDDGNPEDIRQLVLKCRELKVNIEDYLKTILK